MENNKKFWLGALIVIIIIGGVFMIIRSRDSADDEATTIPEVKNSILVTDQNPNSIAVLVESVGCTQNCFVAIHEDADGQPGKFLASSILLGPRMHRNVSVVVNTKTGATYHAMLHGDDGNGAFSATLDMPLKDEAGAVVSGMFKIRETALIDGQLDVKG